LTAQKRVNEQIERLFNKRETLRCERCFCVVLDERIDIGIPFPFGIEPNIVLVLIGIEPVASIFVVLIGFIPDLDRIVETN
jgi:hypothetical protein